MAKFRVKARRTTEETLIFEVEAFDVGSAKKLVAEGKGGPPLIIKEG